MKELAESGAGAEERARARAALKEEVREVRGVLLAFPQGVLQEKRPPEAADALKEPERRGRRRRRVRRRGGWRIGASWSPFRGCTYIP